MKSIMIVVMILVLLVALGGLMVYKVITRSEPPITSKVVAKRELPTFTLLKDEDLEAVPGSNEFKGRYLLFSVKEKTEIKPDMVAPGDATWLANAVAVSVPASTTTTLGGQLNARDLVTLIAVSAKEAKKFENLMVLSIVLTNRDVAAANAITFALPSDQRDEFASAIAGAQLLVTRKIDPH